MAGFDVFSRRMGRLAAAVEANAAKTARLALLEIDRRLVQRTPVDTGRARSNWLVGLGAPTRQTIPATSAQAALARAEAQARAIEVDQDSYISNNLPYVPGLNEGRSRQAGAGFVQDAVRQGARAVTGVRLLED